MSRQLSAWRGAFGDAYVDRNPLSPDVLHAKLRQWSRILARLTGKPPRSILEVGANVGQNVAPLTMLSDATIYAVEPNAKARAVLAESGALAADRIFDATAFELPFEDEAVDLVFTSGVLIHIAPEDLAKASAEIFRVARRYVLCIEYFSDEPVEKPYRGGRDLLFLRDFGAFWLERHPELTVVDYGFFWRPFDLDSLNWWLFRKPARAGSQERANG